MARYIASFAARTLSGPAFSAPCVFGQGGLISATDKREGDKASPVGVWPVRRALFRADRIAPVDTHLRVDSIEDEDGWCDAPDDPAYNRPVRRPYAASHEALKREDGLYDLVVVLGHNDDPPVSGLGSAIFLHCMADDGRATLGCVAVEREALITLVAILAPGDTLEIAP